MKKDLAKPLTPSRLKRALREGRALRAEIEREIRKMKQPNPDACLERAR